MLSLRLKKIVTVLYQNELSLSQPCHLCALDAIIPHLHKDLSLCRPILLLILSVLNHPHQNINTL